MSSIFFWFFAVVMLLFGAGVILNRNPVASALCLVMSFLSLAALFVLLEAYFIGVIQVLVYAGAVMVLFLFIIMLLDLKAEERRRVNLAATCGGVLVSCGFVFQLIAILHRLPAGQLPFAPLTRKVDDVREVGIMLFSNYNLPFQVIGVLVLVATIGVVVLSKRQLK